MRKREADASGEILTDPESSNGSPGKAGEAESWQGFWEIVGAEAYRIWREDQTRPEITQESA